jgi:hypothetical protein
MPGIQAGNPLKSLTTRHTRSSGALMIVLTKAFGISSPPCCLTRRHQNCCACYGAVVQRAIGFGDVP